MKKIKLIRPIKDAAGVNDITEITIKDEDKISASDFYDVEMPTNENASIPLKAFEPVICNLCGLTSAQVAQMHVKDYMGLTGEVGKYFL